MFKKRLQEEVKNLLSSLEEIKDLQLNNIASNENWNKCLENIKETINNGIEKLSKNFRILIPQTEWERFNIAFFGETNAGKSTLIEALIKGNGMSIGDGRKDFTKKINKQSLGNITFLDMPGLEGNEKKVRNEIFKAVNQSHVVFYIIGTNKEPEEGTLQKVRKFLNKKAKVYSILNVRGKPINYKYKKCLVDEHVEKIEERIKKKLQAILNGHYYDNIILNALIGFLAVGKPKRNDLKREQEKLKNIFGDLEKAYQFSNLHKVMEIIEELRQDSLEEIKISNVYKILNSLEKMLKDILKDKKEFDNVIIQLKEFSEKYQRNINDIFMRYNNITIETKNILLNEMENKMRSKVYEGIEDKWSKDYIQQEIDNIKEDYYNKLQNKIRNILKEMELEIENEIKEFENRVDLYINLKKFKVKIDIEEIIKNLKVGIKDFLKKILDIGSSIWITIGAFAINPIIGIITALFTIINKLFEWLFYDPEKRKQEAKQKAYNKIKESVKKVKKEIDKELKFKFNELKKKIKETNRDFREKMRDLKKISRLIDEKIKAIKKTKINISTLLVQEIIDKNIKFAYIDLTLSAALIISNNKISEDKLQKLRIKNIKIFSSLSECMNNVEHYMEKNTIFIKDEFFYRALEALNLDNNDIRFRKWR